MLRISATRRRKAGGILAALVDVSTEYVHEMVRPHIKPIAPKAIERLQRVILHTDPHIDEYFADLLFRACLPPAKHNIPLMEQSVYSQTHDLGARHLWPTAAVLGIGSTFGGGVRPLFLFDEHVSGQAKLAASCSRIVADKMLDAVPEPLALLLRETDAIDEFGGGHPQNLNNIVKVFHDVRFLFDSDATSNRMVKGVLSPAWKRAVVDASIVSVLYCLARGIDVVSDPVGKREALIQSLDNYIKKSPHSDAAFFGKATDRMRSIFVDQKAVFDGAVLRDRQGPIKDDRGQTIPQFLLISRICYAAEKCWGPEIRDIIATHFWEAELQAQLHFYTVTDAVASLFEKKKKIWRSSIGAITRDVIDTKIEVEFRHHKAAPLKRIKASPWVITMTPMAGVLRGHQAISRYLTTNNFGCGVILMKNDSLGTRGLFKGNALPIPVWQRLVARIREAEPECWHVIEHDNGTLADFIVNGNKAHQYVPKSTLDRAALVEVLGRALAPR